MSKFFFSLLLALSTQFATAATEPIEFCTDYANLAGRVAAVKLQGVPLAELKARVRANITNPEQVKLIESVAEAVYQIEFERIENVVAVAYQVCMKKMAGPDTSQGI